MKRVVSQFIKEFSAPFVCALAYLALGKYWPSTGYGPAVKDFGLAFFFVSWFSGNLVRIWRTDRTQTSLNDIKQALAKYESASSEATEANNALLQEIASHVRPGAAQPDPFIDIARRSAEANTAMAAANTAVISVISSSLTQANIDGLYRVPSGMVTITAPVYVPEDHLKPEE